MLKGKMEDGSEKGINVCLSLEAILGATGVSTNCAAYGLSMEQATRMMFDIGCKLYGRVLSVSICDYNPRVEDWRTGRMAVTLFYYFVLGFCQAAK